MSRTFSKGFTMLYMAVFLVMPMECTPLGSASAAAGRLYECKKKRNVKLLSNIVDHQGAKIGLSMLIFLFRVAGNCEEHNAYYYIARKIVNSGQYLPELGGDTDLPRMLVLPLESTAKLCGRQTSVPRLPAGAGRFLQLKWIASSSLRYSDTYVAKQYSRAISQSAKYSYIVGRTAAANIKT